MNEENLATLPDTAPEPAKKIVQYVMLQSRKGLIDKQWYPNIHSDGKIHGDCFHLGAGTHRMTHSGPNMANIPSILTEEDAEGNDVPLKGLERKNTGTIVETVGQ